MIKALAYVVICTPRLAEWCEMAAKLVGLHVEVVLPGAAVRLRMDQNIQRLLLLATDDKPKLTMGFEVEDKAGLAEVALDLHRAGYPVVPGTTDEIALRGVAGMFHFIDPDGSRVEVAWGMRDAGATLQPGRPIGGFRTGTLGIGHVALGTAQHSAMCELYKATLHFKLSDYGNTLFPIQFLHVNPRHHTLGLADTGTGAGVHHLMLEYNDWDDVGRAYDMALENPESIGVSLGRHINDHVTSFYLYTPDGWMLELGWAGRLINADWQVEDLPGLSLWGHDRSWLPQAKRDEAKRVLKKLAARGIRAPIALPTKPLKTANDVTDE